MLRRTLGRKPDIEPGGRQNLISSKDAGLQETVTDAQASLWALEDLFRELPQATFMIKTRLESGDAHAFMWLNAVKPIGVNFSGQLFEHLPGLEALPLYTDIHVAKADVMDRMVNDKGEIYGGFSLRFFRNKKLEVERIEFDNHVGAALYHPLPGKK